MDKLTVAKLICYIPLPYTIPFDLSQIWPDILTNNLSTSSEECFSIVIYWGVEELFWGKKLKQMEIKKKKKMEIN